MKTQCSEFVWNVHHSFRCTRSAVVERESKPYCKIHDPEYIAKKQAERTAKFEAKWAAQKAEMNRKDRMRELAHLIPLRIVSQNCRGFECEKELHDLAVEYLDLEKENG